MENDERRKRVRTRSDESQQRPLSADIWEFAFVGGVIGLISSSLTWNDTIYRESSCVFGLTICTLLAIATHWYETATSESGDE